MHNYFSILPFFFFELICHYSFQIAYQIARDQFAGRLRETFLILSDDEPRPVAVPSQETNRLSLDPRRDRGSKHRRESDSMSVGSSSNPKRADQASSAEKGRK